MPNFDEGIPSLESTLEAIKTAAARVPPYAENPGEGATAAPGEPEKPGVPELPPAPEKPAEASPTAPEAKPAPAQESISAALNRLMAREAALVEREAKLKEQPSAPPPPKPSPTLDEIRNLYRRDKLAAMKLLDEKFNPQKTAKEFWYRDLGDLAPKEALAELQADQAMGTVEALEAKMESTKQEILRTIEEQRSAQAYEQYLGAIQAYTAKVPDDLPLVKKFTAKKPDRVVTALVGVARKHYTATNQVLTPAQAAAKLEQSLKELQLTDAPAAVVENPVTQEAAPVASVNTLRNKHTVVQPSHQDTSGLDDATLRANTLRALEQAKRARQ